MHIRQVNINILVQIFILINNFFISSTIQGRIDQVNQVLELNKSTLSGARYNALEKWTSQLLSLHQNIINKMG